MPTPFNLIMLSAWHEQGGNTLLRFLDGHPSLFVYPFESQLATPHSSNLLTPAVPLRYSWPEFTTEMSATDAYHAMWDQELKTYLRTPQVSKFKDCGIVMDEETRIAAFQDHCGRLSMPYTADNDERDRSNCSRAHYVEAYFRSTMDAWLNVNLSSKETHYVGYSPPILMDTDKIVADFPSAHVVHIVRNPFSGYADTVKRPFPFSLTRYCQIWNVVQLHAVTYASKYPANFHVVCYEDLVANPRQEMGQLLERLGLPWSDNVLYPSFNGKKLEQVYPWGTIKSATTEANHATAQELTSAQTAAIATECGLMLREWGYA